MTYKRMTEADRRQIHRWRQEGDGQRELDRTDSKEALEVTGALCGLFGQLPPSARLSLTLDNASGQIENSHWCLIQKRFKIPGLWWKLEHADSMLAPRVARKKSTMDAFCQ